MASEVDEMVSLLAKLEAKRDALNQMIEGGRAYLAAEGAGAAGIAIPREITATVFWHKTIPEATKIYLQMCNKKPQTTQQVADALLKGGMETNAKDFPATVNAMLRRTESQTDEIIRVPSGEWALPEWFPDRPRKKRSSKDKGGGGGGAGDSDDSEVREANGAAA